MRKKKAAIFLVFLIILSSFPNVESQINEGSGSIEFQPSEVPNIEFSYNQEEYQFELTWKGYYLNIKPFAIYNQKYYTLKQIIPVLKNNFPNIDYRTAVKKFKNYKRWGFWLEKLPQEVSNKLDYLGFELEHNIPLSVVEIEEIEDVNFTFKRIHIANKLTLDFYELYERGFSVEINKTKILIGNVKGKTNLDLDPIVYSAPIITVTGFTEGTPCNLWDIWNASDANGWDMVNNTCDTQFKFWAKLVIGDNLNPAWFADTQKEIVFADGIVSSNYENLIHVTNYATFRLGSLGDAINKLGEKGCNLIFKEDSYHVYGMKGATNATLLLYASKISFTSHISKKAYIVSFVSSMNRLYNTILDGIAVWNFNGEINRCYLINHYSYNLLDPASGFNCTKTLSLDPGTAHLYFTGGTYTVQNFEAYDGTYFVRMQTNGGIAYIVDSTSDIGWKFLFIGEGISYRQYTFNLFVVDKNGDPIENAEVTLSYSGQGGGTYSRTTYANGSITEQVLGKGFYNKTGGDTIYLYEPYTLKIEAIEYIPQTFIFNMTEPIKWEIPLISWEDGVIVTNVFNFSEWVWIFIGLWIFVTVLGFVKKDEIVSAIGGILGIIFGIMYLSTDFMISLGMILLNFYLLYDAMGD